MYSSAISGLSVSYDWLLLVFFGAYLETAAIILLFLNVAMILREKLCQFGRLKRFLIYSKMSISSNIREKVSKKQTIKEVEF